MAVRTQQMDLRTTGSLESSEAMPTVTLATRGWDSSMSRFFSLLKQLLFLVAAKVWKVSGVNLGHVCTVRCCSPGKEAEGKSVILHILIYPTEIDFN